MSEQLKIASLEPDAVSKIQALEAELGASIMAFEPGGYPAALTDEQLGSLRSLEQDLGVTLLAFEA